MAFNGDCYDVEKYQFKWLRVFGLCERCKVRVLCMPFMCYLIVIILFMCMIMLSDNKTLEL